MKKYKQLYLKSLKVIVKIDTSTEIIHSYSVIAQSGF